MKLAQLDYKKKETRNYLHLLHELSEDSLIVPSADRDLSTRGRDIVTINFPIKLNLTQIVNCCNVRQLQPDFSEIDAFVLEASEVVFALAQDSQKQAIDVYECRRLMPRFGTYVLAGVYTLQKSAEHKLLEINPPGAPRGQGYVRYTKDISCS